MAPACCICFDEEGDMMTASCGDEGHSLCSSCCVQYVKTAIANPRKQGVVVCGQLECPAGDRCDGVLSLQQVSSLDDDEIDAVVSRLLRTVPLTKKPMTLREFGYKYNERGELVMINDETQRFAFVNQRHYDMLGNVVVTHIQKLMRQDAGMHEVLLPLSAPIDSDARLREAVEESATIFKDDGKPNPKSDSDNDDGSDDEAAKQREFSNVFASPDLMTNKDTVLVLLQGSGAVRAGMWARALCINNSLDLGTVLPYLKRAHANKWATIVLNPNLNAGTEVLDHHDDGKHDDDEDEYSKNPKPEPTKAQHLVLSGYANMAHRFRTAQTRIPGNHSPSAHTLYVWDNILRHTQARNLMIVAHSAGGHCTMQLLRRRMDEVLPRLRCVAFTDSVHSAASDDPKQVVTFLRNHCINWVRSDLPVGAKVEPEPIPESLRRLGYSNEADCKLLSAGHHKHEFTSGTAIDSVFAFLQQKLDAKKQ